jgi:ATP-binding cassette, subfamily A (ABC1), member 3
LTHFWALVTKRINYFRRDVQGLVCEIILPCLVVVGGLAILTIDFFVESPAAPLSLSEYPDYIPTSTIMSYTSATDKTSADSL